MGSASNERLKASYFRKLYIYNFVIIIFIALDILSKYLEKNSSIFKKLPEHFPAQTHKTWKKTHSEKFFLYFRKWNFLALIFKKSLYSPQRKLFLFFWKWNSALFTPSFKNKRNPPQKQKQNFLTFWKMELTMPEISLYSLSKKKLYLIFLHQSFLYQNYQKKFLCRQ